MTQPKLHHDVRMRAVLITSAFIIVGGILIAYFPGWIHTSPSRVDGSSESQAARVREKSGAEIKQRFEQGVALLGARKYEQALGAFHRVLELSPNMPEAHVNAGFALIGMRRYSVARDFFESALALRKDQINAYYGLAEALEGLNDLPGAMGAMRTYLHLTPADDLYRRKAESAIWEWETEINGTATLGKRKNELPSARTQ